MSLEASGPSVGLAAGEVEPAELPLACAKSATGSARNAEKRTNSFVVMACLSDIILPFGDRLKKKTWQANIAIEWGIGLDVAGNPAGKIAGNVAG